MAPSTDDEPISRGRAYRYPEWLDPWRPESFVATPRPGGYSLEAFVEATELELSSWELAPGGRVGLDLSVNVSTTDGSPHGSCGVRLGQFFLRVTGEPDECEGASFCDVRAFCIASLLPR